MTVGIIGLGIIGGSMAAAIKKHTGHRVLGRDILPEALETDMLLGYVDGELTDEGLQDCDIVIPALYPHLTVEVLRQAAPFISKSAVVIDCAGIKRDICREGRGLADRYGWTFIGGHPMAGREVWGYKAAGPGLFSGASMILTPDGDVDIGVLSRVRDFFLEAGFGTVTVRTPEDHDRIIAYTSQLAHVLSASYVMSPTASYKRQLSAGSFRDMTRVAVINGGMWSDIFIENKDFLIPEIDRLIGNLKGYRDAIEAEDREGLVRMMAVSTATKKEISKPGPRKG